MGIFSIKNILITISILISTAIISLFFIQVDYKESCIVLINDNNSTIATSKPLNDLMNKKTHIILNEQNIDCYINNFLNYENNYYYYQMNLIDFVGFKGQSAALVDLGYKSLIYTII